MKKSGWKNWIIIGVVLVTILLVILSMSGVLPTQYQMSIGDAMEVLVLTMISYYLVARDAEDSRKRDAILRLISKLQAMLSEVADLHIGSEEQKKIARIKLTNVSNYIEILKDATPEVSEINLIINDVDNLSSIVLDHIDDKEYIEKSYSEIYRLISNINTKLEQVAFKVV